MSVAFEPEPIGRRRRRLPDRAALLAILAIAFVSIALLKPWMPTGPAASPGTGTPTPAATPAPGSSDGPDLAFAGALLAALPPHDAWGLRSVASAVATDPGDAVSVGGVAFTQRWTSVGPAVTALSPAATALAPIAPYAGLPRSESPPTVVANVLGPLRYLGLTSPARDPVLDVRVSRTGPDVAEPRWLDVRLPVDDLGLGEWLLPPPWIGGHELPEWPSGTYRIDILRSGPVERLTVVVPRVPSRPDTVPLTAPFPIYQHDPGGSAGWPPGDGTGPTGFVVADGQAIPLPGRLGPPLDERSAWLAAAPLDSSLAPAVVHGWVPSASGIGLRFPLRARAVGAHLVRLAPAYADIGNGRIGSVGTPDGDVPWAIVDAPTGSHFAPGSYRLDVSWRDGTGDRTHTGSIHLELAPGPLGTIPRWLSSARGMARWAGEVGFVVGIAARIEGASTDSLMRFLPESPDDTIGTVDGLGASCTGGVGAEAGDAVLGLVDTGIRATSDVRVVRLGAGGDRADVPVRAVLAPVPGLILLAPTDGPWSAGDYAVTLSAAGRAQRWLICLAGIGGPASPP